MAIFTVWNKSTQHERSRVQVQNTLLVHRKLWCIAPFAATFKFTISDKQFQFSSAKSYIHVYSIYLLAADMIDAIQAWKQNKDSNYLQKMWKIMMYKQSALSSDRKSPTLNFSMIRDLNNEFHHATQSWNPNLSVWTQSSVSIILCLGHGSKQQIV